MLSHADVKGTDGAADVGEKTSGAFQLVNAVGGKAQPAGRHLTVREYTRFVLSILEGISEFAGTVVNSNRQLTLL